MKIYKCEGCGGGFGSEDVIFIVMTEKGFYCDTCMPEFKCIHGVSFVERCTECWPEETDFSAEIS